MKSGKMMRQYYFVGFLLYQRGVVTAMEWTELLIEIPVEFVGPASDIACMAVPYGFYLEDYSDLEQGAWEIAHIDLIDEDLIAKNRKKAVIHIYISPSENPAEAADYLKTRFDSEKIPYTVTQNGIREEDWADNWKQFFKPARIGDRLLILPEWETDENEDARTVLKIDPGAAFGTGTHATTRLCLEMIENQQPAGKSVLDIGSGSGILSIASLLLGADRAVGVDIDPLAVKTAEQNAEKNGFYPPKYTAVCGDLDDKISDSYDIVIANIVADVIIRLCGSVRRHVKDGGMFIASGIIDQREQEVAESIERAGFRIISRRESDGWLCFAARKI